MTARRKGITMHDERQILWAMERIAEDMEYYLVGDDCDTHLRDMHSQFAVMAAIMGYRLEAVAK